MIFWSGLGFCVPLIPIGCAIVSQLVFDNVLGRKYYETHSWTLGLALLVAAAICWLLARHRQKQPDRVMIDKATGQEVVFSPER